jgi:hypothetical protein
MQTTDELTNIRMLFRESADSEAPTRRGSESPNDVTSGATPVARERGLPARAPTESEAQALSDLSAMPIYFASSYSLVKPYVTGFDANVLDAPSLKTVRINTNWRPAETTERLQNRGQ